MAIKIIEKENGEVITKTSRQIHRERRINKFQKYISTAAICTMFLILSSVTAFAANSENNTPSDVTSTSTMNTLIDIIMWLVRIAILAIGAVPGIIKIVQGQQEENPRDRNNGIVSVVISGAGFAATFAISALIKA